MPLRHALSVLFLFGCAGAVDTGPDDDTNTDADTDEWRDPDCTYLPDGPPLYCSSEGFGGASAVDGVKLTTDGVEYWLITPEGAGELTDVPVLMLKSGVEGKDQMANNFTQSILPVVEQSGAAGYQYLLESLIVVFEGRYVQGQVEPETTAEEMATVLDFLREQYDVDNDRMYFLSESAGTQEGLRFAFDVRQSYLAAYWANDVNARDVPAKTTDELAFTPSGNAGPGGDYPDANAIVDGMRSAGYTLPADAPYSGSGSGEHGSSQQFSSALQFFDGRRRVER